MSLKLEIPGWDRIASEASRLWTSLTEWGKSLEKSRQDIFKMKAALVRYPQKLGGRRTAILALETRQRQLDQKYFGVRESIQKIRDYLKSWVPGVSGLAVAPLVIPIAVAISSLAAAASLGAMIVLHYNSVSTEKALIERLSPQAAKEILEKRGQGFFGEAKNLIVLGIVAVVLLPMLSRRG